MPCLTSRCLTVQIDRCGPACSAAEFRPPRHDLRAARILVRTANVPVAATRGASWLMVTLSRSTFAAVAFVCLIKGMWPWRSQLA